MLVTFSQQEEHLPYVLSSAVWNYKQSTDQVLNTICTDCEFKELMAEAELIRDVIYPATLKPVSGEKFSITCDEPGAKPLIVKILHHYLKETKDILSNIEEPLITQKCLQDMDIIENQLIKAIS